MANDLSAWSNSAATRPTGGAELIRSAAVKAFVAFRQGRLSGSPLAWLRLLRLHYRESKAARSALADSRPRCSTAETVPATSIARAVLDEMLAAGNRLQFSHAREPVVSVLVAVHNRAELTLRCLRSLAAVTIPIEIVVVDNGSTDVTATLLDHVDGVVVIRNSDNAGFILATNQAAQHARADLLLLLNNDTELLPGSLEAAVKTLLAADTAGAVVGKLVHFDGRLQEAGSIIWRDGSCAGYGRGDDPLAPAYMFRRDVDFGSGAFLLTRRRTFLESGGFDTRFKPAYYEDADYCTRLWRSGQRVVYEPRAVVMHQEFASGRSSSDAIAMQAARQSAFAQQHDEWLRTNASPPGTSALHARTRHCGGQRVLLIEDCVPHERLGSGFPRSRAMTRAAIELGHHVTVYPLQFADETWNDAYSDLPREAELMVGLGRAGLARFLGARYSYYDSIIVSRPHNMKVVHTSLPARRRERRPALVYDAEALFAVRDIGRSALSGEPLADSDAERMIAAELSLAAGCDLVITATRAEGRRFTDQGFANVVVLGNSLTLQPTVRSFEERMGFLFVGAISGDTAPNADALIWLIREILPRLRVRLGDDARLVVAGRNASADVASLVDPSVDTLGMVAEIAPLHDRARAFLAPIRFGAGLPTKVQQAAAFGVPVVCTSLVAQQLDWTDGVELLVADDADRFADHCQALYQDPELWRGLRQSALARVARECSPDLFRATLAQALQAVQKVPSPKRPPR